MNRMNFVVVLAASMAVSTTGIAQQVTNNAPTEPATEYSPSPAFPFGRRHPDAPAELAQFDFMIGKFDCVDEIRQADGSRLRFPAIWGAHYFLNGFAVQDEYWSPRFSTSNIRVFDPDEGVWVITFFRMPGYQSGVWKGGLEGDRLVFRNGGRTSGPGLTFYDITEDGFEWMSGGDDPGWTSSCKRR